MSKRYDSGNNPMRKSFKRLDSTAARVLARSWRLIHFGSTTASAIGCFGLFFLAPLFILGLDARAEVETEAGTRATSTAKEYKLGPQDEIRVRVLEWRPSSDVIFEWAALNANYTIGPRFKLSLPLIGQVSVEGLTLGQLGTLLARRLKARMGLVLSPDVSVEIVKYRPFYVVGDVENPGEYSYRPGLNVLQAVSLGGGFLRNDKACSMRLDRDIAVSQGERELLVRERDTLTARKARLEAELRGADEISFPKELTGREDDVATARLMQQENLVFRTRKKAYETQSTVLNELHKYLQKEVVSLTAQMKARDRQLALLQEEKASLDGLAQKKLVRLARVLDVKRELANFEVEGLRTQAQLSKAQQDISRNQIAVVELKNQRETDLRTVLQQTDNRFEEIARRMATLQKLLYEAQVIAPMRVAQLGKNLGVKPQYTVVRHVDGEAIELHATDITELLPGDTLKVELVLPTGGTAVKPNGFNTDPAATLREKNKRAAVE